MATETSKKEVIDKMMEELRGQVEACWETAEGGVVEGSGDDIHGFVGGLHELCSSFGQSALRAYLENRDEQQFEKRKKKRERADLESPGGAVGPDAVRPG